MNGPQDVVDWNAIDWRNHEQNVVRLRRRIFKATREQDWAKVRSLQKMMLRSWSNTLVSVRQVTQRNTGRRAAGIDGEVALTSSARAEMAVRAHRSRSSWDPLPVRVHPARHHLQRRRGSPLDPRRSRHVHDLEHGHRPARPAGHRPVPFPPARVQ
ncbi:reverse transcriptase N-terminal domain-containing protein [Actinomadura sp. CNU-125]|uniref:reverse transcriptase N-terminal domain-containing protein n=1 Tax=Actinomadura sp. CNU-125 TaxID=1904961 RepID=UPI00396789B3